METQFSTHFCLKTDILKDVRANSLALYLFSYFCLMNTMASQPCEFMNPCRELSGAVLADLPTLCESVTGFEADYTIRDGAYASGLLYDIWDYSVFNGVDILIQGTFYVDERILFQNCRVKMASGAQIIVTSQMFKNQFKAILTKFFSCDDMWKGIVLEAGTRCTMFSCMIEDAQYALTVGNYVSLGLYGNTFNRNFVGITNDPEVTTLPFLLFKNNTFDCTSDLSDYFDLEFENFFEDPVSFAGILLNNCSSSIGYYGSRNRFNNLNYGIFAKDGTVSIKGCVFRNAQHGTVIPDLVQEYPLSGCAIAGLNSNILVIGDEENISSTFEGADILTLHTNLTVTWADFLDSGIYVGDNESGETVIIEDNELEGIDRVSAIGVVRSMASGEEYHTSISRNTVKHLNTGFYPLFGIHINGRNNATDYARVDHNTIKSAGIYDQYSGIRYTVFGSDHTEIDNNFIQFVQTDNKIIGIYALLGAPTVKGSRLMHDTIFGGNYYDAFHETYGISALVAPGLTYCSNRTDQLGYGMTFIGNCNNSDISQNELDILGLGLQLRNLGESPGVFGVQNGTRNRWLNDGATYSENSAQNITSISPSFSSYNIVSTDGSNELYNPDNVFPASGWFVPFDGDPELCLVALPIVNGYDSLIITNDIEYSGLQDGTKFFMEKSLLYKILSDGGLTTYYSTFLSGEDDKSEYALALAEIGMKEAMQMDLTDQSDLDGILTSMQSLYDSIQLYNDYNYTHIDSTTFTEGLYLDSLHSKLEQIWDATEEQQSIKSDRMTLLISDLADISSDLAMITPRGTFDEYYITIYTLLIEKITNGYLDPGDYEVLNDIAHDFEDNSLANVTAFEYFDLCSEHAYPNYSMVCEEEPRVERKGTVIEEVVVSGFSSEVSKTLTINCSEGFEGSVDVFDLTGRSVFKSRLSGGLITISFDTKLLPGIYYFRVMSDVHNKVIHSGLIPIIE